MEMLLLLATTTACAACGGSSSGSGMMLELVRSPGSPGRDEVDSWRECSRLCSGDDTSRKLAMPMGLPGWFLGMQMANSSDREGGFASGRGALSLLGSNLANDILIRALSSTCQSPLQRSFSPVEGIWEGSMNSASLEIEFWRIAGSRPAPASASASGSAKWMVRDMRLQLMVTDDRLVFSLAGVQGKYGLYTWPPMRTRRSPRSSSVS
mmetsp:Transcript_14641/g.37286  ORF Transcript_14641/g.37286 Transcript_14641/m.37286 type:complete len:209 (-) Transcript_14641:141-767(-)